MRVARVVVGVGLASVVAACGPSARLTEFSCQEKCQDVADPFLLKLNVAYDDPEGILPAGRLIVRIDDTQVGDYALSGLVPAGQTQGTIPFDLPVKQKLTDGQRFRVAAKATTDAGDTNELSLPLIVKF